MDHAVLGKILATLVTAAIDAGAIATSSGGILTNPGTLGSIVQGFLSIWVTHPASGQTAASAVVKSS
jgi:hypothetical protein